MTAPVDVEVVATAVVVTATEGGEVVTATGLAGGGELPGADSVLPGADCGVLPLTVAEDSVLPPQ